MILSNILFCIMNYKTENCYLFVSCFKDTTYSPEITRASLYYLRWLPNTTKEIGIQIRFVNGV